MTTMGRKPNATPEQTPPPLSTVVRVNDGPMAMPLHAVVRVLVDLEQKCLAAGILTDSDRERVRDARISLLIATADEDCGPPATPSAAVRDKPTDAERKRWRSITKARGGKSAESTWWVNATEEQREARLDEIRLENERARFRSAMTIRQREAS